MFHTTDPKYYTQLDSIHSTHRQPTADLTQMPMTNPNSAWQAQPTAVPQFAPMLDNTAAYHAMPGPAAYRYPAPPTQAQQQPMWGHQDLAGPSSTIYRYPTPLTLAQQGQLASASIAELYNINSGNFFHCLSSLYHDLGSSYRDVGTRLHGTTPRHHYGGPDVHGTSPLLNAQPEPLFPHAPSYALKMLKLRHAVRETRHFTALILQEAMDEWHKLERGKAKKGSVGSVPKRAFTELRIYGRQTQTDIPKSLTGDIEQLRICDDLGMLNFCQMCAIHVFLARPSADFSEGQCCPRHALQSGLFSARFLGYS